MARPVWTVTIAALALGLAACGSDESAPPRTDMPGTPTSQTPHASETSDAVEVTRMPDLRGLASEVAGQRLVRFAEREGIRLSQEWARPVRVDSCAAQPGTVARQRPAPGTALEQHVDVVIQVAELDLDGFRGPCEPMGGELGPVLGADAAVARELYRFAADPTLGAPFVAGDVWVGIEDGGPGAVHLDATERPDLAAWKVGRFYAERSGPFSALDMLASSGGYYEVNRGISTCAGMGDGVAPELTHLRAITLTPAPGTVGACLAWWGVTLYLDDAGLIHGVALRLGSP
jgi:hypothetical protein